MAVGRTTEKEASMLGRKEPQKAAAPQIVTNGHSAAPITLLTVIGDTAKFEGKFEIADSIQIECEIGGELRVGGKLVIGEKGVVNANVRAGIVLINGEVVGNVAASERVELRGSARIFGDVEAPVVVVEEGVMFDGKCKMTKGQSAEAAAPRAESLDRPAARQLTNARE